MIFAGHSTLYLLMMFLHDIQSDHQQHPHFLQGDHHSQSHYPPSENGNVNYKKRKKME